MNKPRIRVRPDLTVPGMFWLLPKTKNFWTVQVTRNAMRDLEGFALMLENIGARLVLRNLQDSIILN